MEFFVAECSRVTFYVHGSNPSTAIGTILFDEKFMKDPRSLSAFEWLQGIDLKRYCPSWDIEIILQDEPNDQSKLEVALNNSLILADIDKFLGVECVTVQVTFSELRSRNVDAMNATPPEIKISTKEMVVEIKREKQWRICRDDALQFPVCWMDVFRKTDSGYLSVKVTVKLTVHLFPGSRLEQPESCYVSMYKEMFEDDETKDVTIVARDGEQVRCHKLLLVTCSPVFKAMFQAGMKESQSNTIEIPDMTDEAVLALLKYVYYQGKDKPNDKCGIAFELLCAAHKYQVGSSMEAVMRQILLSKPVEWYDLDVALKLFQFARILPSGDELKMKAFQVLKANSDSFQLTPTSKEMFQKNPEAAAELVRLSLSSNS